MSAWPLSPSGLLFDRAWALVDGGGKALTQKVYPRLVLVQPAINLRDRAMIVRAPGMAEDLVVPLGDTNDGIRGCGGKEHCCEQTFTTVSSYGLTLCIARYRYRSRCSSTVER